MEPDEEEIETVPVLTPLFMLRMAAVRFHIVKASLRRHARGWRCRSPSDTRLS